MKIYFEDGRLNITSMPCDKHYHMVDATDGFSRCFNELLYLKSTDDSVSVYTNFIAALHNQFAWNKELKTPEIYLRRFNGWVRIDELTDRELREGHNIEKMWITGAFE